MTSTLGNAATDTLPTVTPDDFEAARQEGRRAQQAAKAAAPIHPLLLIAWAQGFEEGDLLQDAVAAARAMGVKWELIAGAVGEESAKAAEARYGRGRARNREYQQRKRRQGQQGDNSPS